MLRRGRKACAKTRGARAGMQSTRTSCRHVHKEVDWTVVATVVASVETAAAAVRAASGKKQPNAPPCPDVAALRADMTS